MHSLIAAPEILASTGVQSLSFNSSFAPTSLLVAGLNVGLDDGVNHIILFANDPFAQSTVGLKWSNFFAPVRHSDFVTWIGLAHGGDSASLAALGTFFQGAQAGSAAFGPSDPFTILQFTVSNPVGGAVPEAGTAAAGFGCLGVMAYAVRRRMHKRRE